MICIANIDGLTHWGRVMHICVSKLTSIASVNGLLPGQCQAIIWTNAGILLIGLLGTNFSEILIRIQTFSFKEMHFENAVCKMASILSRPQCVYRKEKWLQCIACQRLNANEKCWCTGVASVCIKPSIWYHNKVCYLTAYCHEITVNVRKISDNTLTSRRQWVMGTVQTTKHRHQQDDYMAS